MMSAQGWTRRHFIQAGLLLTPAVARAARWQNWSGRLQAQSLGAIGYPRDEQELLQWLRSSNAPLRVVGGGHSFSPLVPTTGRLLSLEAMNGLIDIDQARLRAEFWAGTRIAAASPLLAQHGQGFFNEADINMQSLAGAISTATHGSGRRLQCLSAYVRQVRLITAQGEIIDCSAEHEPDVFAAAQVSLGALGIITRITLQNRAAYRLHERLRVLPIAQVLDIVEREKDQHEHIEFFAFPFGDRAMLKTMDSTLAASTPLQDEDDNTLLDLAANTARVLPWSNPWLQRLIGLLVADSDRVGPSYAIYPSARSVRFNEMEYSLPAEHGRAAIEAIMQLMRKEKLDVFFPLEYRFVAADDAWLSPFYQRSCVSISVHQYYRQRPHPIFSRIEPILQSYGGRPHWGKMNSWNAAAIASHYPRYPDWLQVRQRLDPQGRMLNGYMHHLLGV